jgi:hypothetical protein
VTKDQTVLNKERFKSAKTDLPTDTVNQINKIVDDRVFRNTDIISKSLQTDFLPLRLAAIKYHISESYLYKLHYKDILKFYKLGSLTYVKSSELENLFQPVSA